MQYKKHIILSLFFILFASICLFWGKATFAQRNPSLTFHVKSLFPILLRHFKPTCGFSFGNTAHCFAKVITQNDGTTPLANATPLTTSLGPVQFHTAYQLPCQPGGSVASSCPTPSQFGPQTIAIVDAFHNPTIENDLSVYSTYFGIPSCTKANGCLNIVDQTGGNNLPAITDAGWTLEASLDTQVAHAICQTCKILLVETNSNSLLDLATGVNTAANLGATAISNSYGGSEFSGEKNYDTYYTHPGIAITASSGDSGYGTEYPATSPSVVSVGGTTLQLFTDSTYASESVWGSAGSGCSLYENANSWQTSLSNWSLTGCFGKRAVADVAAVADPNTGAAVYDSTAYSGQSGWWQVGGTSLSSPLIAALFAESSGVTSGIQASSLLYANYSLSYFHDITTGNNGFCGGRSICTAVAGFDGPTGLGTPNGLGGFMATPTPTITPLPTATPTPTLTPTPTPPDTQLPTINITNPINGSRVRHSSTVTISANASDNVGVTKVEFSVNNVLLATKTITPYRVTWFVPSKIGVVYTLSAKAYDAAGNTATSSVTVTSR